ncbi:M56 family metallopeptidase [Gilvibacter sediminis]|uniref:M56 family metallopeptidase n=1 Tax=Gilvibacter sediminis TaxID=379071 RepID=UPI00234FFFBB|nr:M56 family metallopeptidase [Gilvibacter sediminis]MDC7997266.1 M56 family metallopeptidase [Gilvibacter sediminis]
MAHYIIQTLIFQLLFLLVYDLFLKKETFFHWNRWYLLGTAALSLVLPFIQIAAIGRQISPELRVQLPAVFIGGEGFVPTVANPQEFVFPWQLLWQAGAVIMGIWFAVKLVKILRMRRKGKLTRLEDFALVILPNSKSAFSFWSTVFLGADLAPEQREMILHHEQVHVRQRHTLDQLFFELLRIVFWFNPLVYLYQARITSLQEYIADAEVAASKGKSAYYQQLLSQVFQTENVSFINTFFNHSLIKKRISMLQKSRSSRSKLLKFALLLPLLAVMVVYTSCSQESPTTADAAAKSSDADVMTKIEELSEAIMAQGNLTEDERRALEFLATPAKEGDKVYESVGEYLAETEGKVVEGRQVMEYQSLQDGDPVPFAAVDRVPIYPGCTGTNEELKACFSQKLSMFVNDAFNKDLPESLGLVGTLRIAAIFKVDVNGQIVDIKSRAPHPGLEEETNRVLGTLPTLTPGEQDGQPVGVLYSLPIVFHVAE